MNSEAALGLAFAIGAVSGSRSMTAPAAVSWAARLHWLHLDSTRLAFFGHVLTTCVFSALATAELVADKTSWIPSRRSPGPFAARVVLGGLSGTALCAAARESQFAGLAMGALGGAAGTLLGYQARTRLVKALGTPDYVIAVAEDIVAVGSACLIVSRQF